MSDISITTKNSPWYENGQWYWYVGNTVAMEYKFKGLHALSGDKIKVEFHSEKTRETVLTYEFTDLTSQEIEGEWVTTIIISINKTDSAKLVVGDYVFCITYLGSSETNIKTICAEQKVGVESCH